MQFFKSADFAPWHNCEFHLCISCISPMCKKGLVLGYDLNIESAVFLVTEMDILEIWKWPRQSITIIPRPRLYPHSRFVCQTYSMFRMDNLIYVKTNLKKKIMVKIPYFFNLFPFILFCFLKVKIRKGKEITIHFLLFNFDFNSKSRYLGI